ncbi:MAG: hypothetical protein ACHQXL_00675 [Candidatus Limnocylindrales bacterium]
MRIRRLDRGALGWTVVVVLAYVLGTLVVAHFQPARVNPAMQVALALSHGRLNIALPAGTNDTASVGGLTYQVISPLPIVPYLLFVPFPALWAPSRLILGCAIGIMAAWLMLPFARRYAGRGPQAYWLATLGAFGTLLFDLSIQGDFYYLAQVEAMLFTLVALIELSGRRRPWLLGLALALAFLARPTLILAAIPIGLAVLVSGHDRGRTLLLFALPLTLGVALTGLYDAVRFGSAWETGYAISTLGNPVLARARSMGLFSLQHVPDNLGRLVARGFDLRATFPFLVPDPYGHSVLLTSPGLLIAVRAGLRRNGASVLWSAAGLLTAAVLLYYGGGGWETYGFRYFLDAVPFLLALVGLAIRDRLGTLAKLLIVLSVVFVCYDVVWIAFK